MDIPASELKKETIISTVYNYFGADASNRRTKSTKRIHNTPRQISMYLLCLKTDDILREIGAEFDRDHSSVVYSRGLVGDLMATDKKYRQQVQEIEQLLKN